MPRLVERMYQDKRLTWLWLVVRVWMGWQWFEAGLHKIGNEAWWGAKAGTALNGYWMKAAGMGLDAAGKPLKPGATYVWYQNFLKGLVNSNSSHWFSYLIVLGELLVGIGLMVGGLTFVALIGGALMNMNYMLAGSASSNPVLFFLAIILMLAWDNTWYIGIDRVILPFIGSIFGRKRSPMASAPAVGGRG